MKTCMSSAYQMPIEPKSFFANLADRAAICIVQFHICDFKLWGLQNAVLKSFLVFFGQND